MVDAPPPYRHALDEGPGVDVTKIQLPITFGNDNRFAAVGREIQVVGVADWEGTGLQTRTRVDHRKRIARGVIHVQVLQVPAWRYVLRRTANPEVADDPIRRWVDDVGCAGQVVGHVHAL